VRHTRLHSGARIIPADLPRKPQGTAQRGGCGSKTTAPARPDAPAHPLRKNVADGVRFVALASIWDPELVVSTITKELGIKEAGQRLLLEILQAYLGEKHLLLLLDNFEQVAEAAPALTQLLQSCPNLKVLVSSREVLHLSDACASTGCRWR
jgi:predicted ATPase